MIPREYSRFSGRVNVMSDEQIHRVAPSVFAEDKHESRSSRYRFFNTGTVLDAMRQNGFLPVRAQQTNVRDESKRAYTKHMIRFRPAGQVDNAVGEHFPEIVLTNAHDGTAAYRLYLGLYRQVCSNGLVVNSANLSDHRVRHNGPESLIDEVIDVSFKVLDEAPTVLAQVEDWQASPVSRGQALAFADAALTLRWEPDAAPVTPEALLGMRRYADESTDVWTTANRVQENLIRGGVRGRGMTGRRIHTRAVNSVNEDVRLNRALWRLTEEFAKMV